MSESSREGLNDLDLESRVEQYISKIVERGGDVSGVSSAYHGNGVGTLAYYENDGDAQVLTKSQKRQMTKILGRGRSLPSGYTPQFKSFSQYLREGYNATEEWKKMTKASAEQLQKRGDITKANAYSSLDSESMGAVILPEFAPEIADVMYDEDDLMGQTDQYSISGEGIKLPRVPARSREKGKRHGGVSAGWLDEGDEIQETRGKLDETELRLKKLAVVVFLNMELINDESYALEQWVTRSVRSEIKFMVGDSLVNGTGGGMPMGYAKSGAASVVARATGGSIEAADILKMYSRRRPGVPVTDYVWHMNQEAEVDLQLMTVGSGGSQLVTYIPPGGGLSQSPYSTLMGLPVRTLEYCNAKGTKGDIALVRMKGMASVTKGGVNETASSHVGFLRDKEAIKFVMRMDARPMYDTPTKAYKGTAGFEYADFVLLDG